MTQLRVIATVELDGGLLESAGIIAGMKERIAAFEEALRGASETGVTVVTELAEPKKARKPRSPNKKKDAPATGVEVDPAAVSTVVQVPTGHRHKEAA